jgi:hypothetical protein
MKEDIFKEPAERNVAFAFSRAARDAGDTWDEKKAYRGL